MPQPSTQRPPLSRPELPWREQILIRLDEIIGLLDGIDTSLAFLSATVTQPVAVGPAEADANDRSPADLLPFPTQRAGDPEP